MRQILTLLLSLFLLAGFTNSGITDDDNVPPFNVEIAYQDLPDPMNTEYFIDNKRMLLTHTVYDMPNQSYQNKDKSNFKDFDREKIVSFLQQTNWAIIPPQLGKPDPNGYRYSIKIQIDGKTYNFDIQNVYHPTIASLITLCNNAIPEKEKRQKYFLPYNQ